MCLHTNPKALHILANGDVLCTNCSAISYAPEMLSEADDYLGEMSFGRDDQ